MNKTEKAHMYAKELSECKDYAEIDRAILRINDDFKVWHPIVDVEYDLRGNNRGTVVYKDFPRIGVVDNCLYYKGVHTTIKLEFYND